MNCSAPTDAGNGKWMRVEVEGGYRAILSGSLGKTTRQFQGRRHLHPDARRARQRLARGSARDRRRSRAWSLTGEVNAEDQQGKVGIGGRFSLQMAFSITAWAAASRLFARRRRSDRQRVNALAHQIAERGINSAGARPGSAREGGALDDQREMAFAARVVAAMAEVLVRSGPRARGAVGASAAVSRSIISLATGPVAASGSSLLYRGVWSEEAWRQGRRNGTDGSRGAERCAVPGCPEPGEFQAPLSPADFDGLGSWQWLCLDHVREHNARYNYFEGMSPEEIERGAVADRGLGAGDAGFAAPEPTAARHGATSPTRSTPSPRASGPTRGDRRSTASPPPSAARST